MNRDSKKKNTPFYAEDFMPSYKKESKPETGENMKQKAQFITTLFGGDIK